MKVFIHPDDPHPRRVAQRHVSLERKLKGAGCLVYISRFGDDYNYLNWVTPEGVYYIAQLRGEKLGRWDVNEQAPGHALNSCRCMVRDEGLMEMNRESPEMVARVYRRAFEEHVESKADENPLAMLNVLDEPYALQHEEDWFPELSIVQQVFSSLAGEQWTELLSNEDGVVRRRAMILCARFHRPQIDAAPAAAWSPLHHQ
jgi:hypothetical protein